MARASSTSSKGEVERKSRREEKGEAGGRRAGGGKYDDSLSANAKTMTSLPRIPPFLKSFPSSLTLLAALLHMPPPSHVRPPFVGSLQPRQPLPEAQLPDESAPPFQNVQVPVLHPLRDKVWTWGTDRCSRASRHFSRKQIMARMTLRLRPVLILGRRIRRLRRSLTRGRTYQRLRRVLSTARQAGS